MLRSEPFRALVVYGFSPSGHAAAAAALEEPLQARGFVVSRVEVAADYHRVAARAVAEGYHALLRASPEAWGRLYGAAWAQGLLRGVRSAYLGFGGARRLAAEAGRASADVIVCPQAAVAAVLAEARRRGALGVPVVSALTDFAAHPFWADPPADLILAPCAEAAAELAAMGVASERLCVCGLPIHPAFASAPDRADARRRLCLPPAAPVVLFSGGSQGLGGIDAAAAALLRENPRAHALALCGRNGRLLGVLSRLPESGMRLRAFGPQPPKFVAAALAAADIHLGKAGGLSAAESLALGVPMILPRPFAGQERVNARRLIAWGAAADGGTPREAGRCAARLLGDRRALARLSAAARAAGRPSAAAAAADEIAALIGFDSILAQK